MAFESLSVPAIWKPFRSAVKCIPVSATATPVFVFRLEVQVVGTGQGVALTKQYEMEHIRNGEKWTIKVTYDGWTSDYKIDVKAPDSVKTFTFRTYERTCTCDIHYEEKGTWLRSGREVAELIIGAEVTVLTDQPAPISSSPWNFTSSKHMDNWDVSLCVGETKFYAHKHNLSQVSTTFRSMFEGDFREKNQQEIPVNVEGTNARDFEAFLQCIYPFGSEPKDEFLVPLVTLADFYDVKPLREKCIGMLKFAPTVPKVAKLRVAIKFNAAEFEDEVIASFTKEDLRALLATDLKDLSVERYQKILSTCTFL